MNTIKRSSLALAAAAVLTASLTACGGSSSSDAPKDASKADFCKAWEGDTSAFDNVKQDDYSGIVKVLHDQADTLAKTGTPKGISDDERKGFEVEVEQVKKLSASDLEKQVKSGNADDMTKALGLSGDDASNAKAFEDYANELCS